MKHMKFNFQAKAIAFHFSWILLLFAAACSPSKKIKSSAEYQPLENSLLWEVTGKDLKKASYVFGTIHMIPEEQFFWTPAMNKYFHMAEEVVFELDVNEMNDLGKMMGMMQYLFMQNDTTLSDLLTQNEYALVSARFEKMGLPLFLFEKMKPFFLTVFLSEDLASGSLQDGRLKSYEMELNNMATAAGIPTSGLETIAFQASMFDKISYKDQAKMLVQMLESDEEQEDSQMDIMILRYTQQEIEGLGDLINAQSDESDLDWQEDLLFRRNSNWIDLMVPMMKDKSVFFAVGAGHLPGEKGVLHLLRKNGYTIKPLK